MPELIQPETHSDLVARVPRELGVLPLRNTVAFPYSVLPLTVGIPRSIRLIEETLEGEPRMIGLVAMRDPAVEVPRAGEVHEVGTVALVHRVLRTPGNGSLQVVVQGIERFRVDAWLQSEPYLRARVSVIPDQVEPGVELEALQRALVDLAREVIALSPTLPDEIAGFLDQVRDPRYLCYLIAANSGLDVAEGQRLLEMHSIKDKLHLLLGRLAREKEVLTLGRKIETEAREEIDKAQREYFLRQQLRAIQKELGESDEGASAAAEYGQRLEHAGLPEEARREAERELRRLGSMPPGSAEVAVLRTYLDWLLELPWHTASEDQLDVRHARTILDEDHYDLDRVKERLVEYLAVRKRVREQHVAPGPGEEPAGSRAMGAILCFVGPPGVGKTSLGQSIARALGRRFTRMSLGGVRDEAEIRGHRRTYIGAMPGRIIQAIKRAGTRNPIFMLDEIDKVGSDWRGDPSSALLEVLDPAQNHAFRDHYLDVDFDLSDVIFITTANQLETIPEPLRDRMEILQLDGYTELEKLQIAERYLVPRQLKLSGLRPGEVMLREDAVRKVIEDYTREAGVRSLERQLGALCRKSVVALEGGRRPPIELTPERVREYLRRERFEAEAAEAIELPGIAIGLAVTAVGGEILFVEATRMRGKGKLTLTGQLGEVMRESAEIAFSYVRSKARQLGVAAEIFEESDVHLHVPAGAVPKDGPSAGMAMTLAMASLFSGRPARGGTGMTGEVTLRGRVLPVGGIKQKVLAAHRAGLTSILLPRRNEPDLEDVPAEVRGAMRFLTVERIDEALELALCPSGTPGPLPLASQLSP